MNSKPIVSIIVPCYKQAIYLPETLDSVLKQTYQNWECIVVNDGSPDNTAEVVEQYSKKDARIRLLSQTNQGLAMARNNGIKNSYGEFILPLDSDDLIESTYIEKAIDYFEKNPLTKLVYCQADRFGDKNEYWNLPEYKYEDEIWQNLIFCSCIYRRRDFDRTSGYNQNMKGGYEDWDFLLSFLKKEDIVYRIPEILFHYRYKKQSMIVDAQKKRIDLYRQIFLNHQDIYQDFCKDLIIYREEYLFAQKIRKLFLYRVYRKFLSLFHN